MDARLWLETSSWIAGIVSASAVIYGVLTWARDRRQARLRPYGLQLALDVAIGDPGHVVFVLNGRDAPVTIEAWGALRRCDVPNRRLPSVVPESRIQRAAIEAVADMTRQLNPMITLDAGSFVHLKTIPGPESALPDDVATSWQMGRCTESEEMEVERLFAFWTEPPNRYRAWGPDEAIVPFVLIPGVGYAFGAATSGPFSLTGGYKGFPCKTCNHDYLQHEAGPKIHQWRRRLTMSIGTCRECGCALFVGDEPPAEFRDRINRDVP